MKLATERLELVAATPELLRAELDGPACLATLLDVATPEVWPPPLNSVETLQYALSFLEEEPERAGWMTWYFIRKDGRVLVGQGGYNGLPQGGSVEIGYSLLPAYQKQGYATEAVRALVDRAFALGLTTVTAQTLPELTPSIRVLERSGFRLVGAGDDEGAIRFALSAARSTR